MLTGRIVDSYTNALTVKLFAHAEREDDYARSALEEQMRKWQASLRLITESPNFRFMAEKVLSTFDLKWYLVMYSS